MQQARRGSPAPTQVAAMTSAPVRISSADAQTQSDGLKGSKLQADVVQGTFLKQLQARRATSLHKCCRYSICSCQDLLHVFEAAVSKAVVTCPYMHCFYHICLCQDLLSTSMNIGQIHSSDRSARAMLASNSERTARKYNRRESETVSRLGNVCTPVEAASFDV